VFRSAGKGDLSHDFPFANRLIKWEPDFGFEMEIPVNMSVSGFGWHRQPMLTTSDELAAPTRDFHAIDLFDPRRWMFESNFPADRISCSYVVLWNALKRIAAGFTDSEKLALLRGTTAKVYRLTLASA
jgi:hypothetical protein